MWNQFAPQLSVLAQQETGALLVVGVLIVALILALIFFRRLSHRSASQPGTAAEPAAGTPAIASAAGPAETEAILDFSTTTGKSVSFVLDKPALTLGRASDNDLVIADPVANADSVSLHHARLRRDQDEYIVRDLGSKNGVLVNGRHTIENVLHNGDRIGFGAAEAVFRKGQGGAA
jgi:pSer/pThr/pTyr-binding forkhead associated (FHA) protein